MELMVPIENKDDTPLYEETAPVLKERSRRKASRRKQTAFYRDPCRQSSCKQKYHQLAL